eukprot:8989406-Ditylum_brightwellii.AAC.1
MLPLWWQSLRKYVPEKTDEDAAEKDKKTGPAGHAHVATDDILKYDEGDEDEDYGDWGSVSIG